MTDTDTRPVYLVNKSLERIEATMLLKDENLTEFNVLLNEKKLVKVSRKKWTKDCLYIAFLTKKEANTFIGDKVSRKLYEKFRNFGTSIYNRFKHQS